MKLLNSLFTVMSDVRHEGGHDFNIKLDPEHFIYKAHFPGEPITPGVCILQISLELLSCSVGAPLEVDTVKNVKFLRVISPLETTQITYRFSKVTCEEDAVKAQVSVCYGEDVFAKLSLICHQA